MKLKHVYLLLCLPGAVGPLSQLVLFLMEEGFNFQMMADELLGSRIGMMFGLDVFIAAIVFFIFVLMEGHYEKKMENLWLPLVATMFAGLSLGFPLYLYQRELQSEKKHSHHKSSHGHSHHHAHS